MIKSRARKRFGLWLHKTYAKRLRLSLNVAFSEISDPKNLCRDVSDRHHWGNGDVEVDLSSVQELPYVMGLVRQAFDSQMGNVADPS